MWSHFNRDVIFSTNEAHKEWRGSAGVRLSYHESAHIKIKELTHNWLKTHSEYDINIRQWIYIHHANEFFKSRNLKFYHVFFPNFEFSDLETKKPNFLKLNNIVPIELNAIDLAHDNSHPGEASHLKFGTDLFNAIQNKEFINIC
jgi:hypothetical protein